MENKAKNHSWTFQHIGGLDQVVLATADDIAHLNELDPKLWAALSCPSSGLEFDERTLALLDEDKDGRIRIPEVIDAVEWLKARLNSLDSIIHHSEALPLSAINTNNPDGERLLTAAKAILVNIGKSDVEQIALEDVLQSSKQNAGNLYNGDGILPADPKLESDIQDFIKDAINIMGAVKDASGKMGINNDIAKAFIKSLADWIDWRKGVGSAVKPLDEDTAEAWQLLQSLQNKIDDYFLRTELASYAPQSQSALNVDEKFIVPSENGLLEDKALAELPLSKVEADKPLDLTCGLNPIWREKILRFTQLITPFMASPTQLTRDEWRNIQNVLAPYAQAVSSKPALVKVAVTTEPTSIIDKLGENRANEILQSDVATRFAKLADKDSRTPAAATDVAAVERLVIYHKHLYRLLMNFVSFRDFFDLQGKAAFQSGRLFIDGRCCDLCIPVTDVAKHTNLANYAELFLLYCECTRKHPPVDGKVEKMTIVAAMTAGNADLLIEGRNGVFIDNRGNDWDAKVIKVITKPISLTQAIWDPYKRMGRFITEQINKWAGSKDAALVNSSSKAVQNVGTPPAADAGASKFDIGRSVGIFAAIGLALGAIGTALASIARSLFELQWWQIPLVFLGIFLIISGPSVIMAWLKLRQRTLGPLLEASGWAVNGKVKINFFLGSQLTSKAELPKNAHRSLNDPMKKGKRKSKAPYIFAFIFALIVGAAAVAGWLWHTGYFAEAKTETLIQAEPETSSETTEQSTLEEVPTDTENVNP